MLDRPLEDEARLVGVQELGTAEVTFPVVVVVVVVHGASRLGAGSSCSPTSSVGVGPGCTGRPSTGCCSRSLLGLLLGRCLDLDGGRDRRGRAQGSLVTVGAVHANRASSELASQQHSELKGWTKFHAYGTGKVLFRQEGQRRPVDPVFTKILQSIKYQ